jgi:hypothetical protein
MPSFQLLYVVRSLSGHAGPILDRNHAEPGRPSETRAIRQDKPTLNQPARFQAGARATERAVISFRFTAQEGDKSKAGTPGKKDDRR